MYLVGRRLSSILLLVSACFVSGLAPPAPGSTVVYGSVRFTVITPTIVRLEAAAAAGGSGFDDRVTMVIASRDLGPTPYNVTYPDAGTVVISTSALTLTYTNKTRRGGGGGECAVLTSTDQTGGTRSPNAPGGLALPGLDDCCEACTEDDYCTTFVFSTQGDTDTNCWLMYDVTGRTTAANRTLGTKGTHAFTAANTRIAFTAGGVSGEWAPGAVQAANLNGTWEFGWQRGPGGSLDCYSNPMDCAYVDYPSRMGPGLLARDGWHVHDDTTSTRLTDGGGGDFGVPWHDDALLDAQDLYFFAYGGDYAGLLGAYASLSGPIAMPPAAALGVWWSRYYPYSETQFIHEVLTGYADNGLPLNVVVFDMDWHTEPSAAGCTSWGGFTFNTSLFPDPAGFIAWLHGSNNTVGHPLRVALNVHPQTGVDHCQDNYAKMAVLNGIDPSTNETVPCDFWNLNFSSSLSSVYLDAPPLAGVTWWWTDYNGCGAASVAWSNYVFDQHQQASRNERPLVLSRYGSLGNQRYPLGFSGDTFQAFETLQYQIRQTKTAANVLFGWWSHDIGGFHTGDGCPGDGDPTNTTGAEMLLRWMQFGAVAPVFRTHCDHCERRIWLFPYFEMMADAMRLRNALFPYIYTAARAAYDTGVAIVRAMYVGTPGEPDAYGGDADAQYMFGPSIIAAPIFAPASTPGGSSTRRVWLPPGAAWVAWNGSSVHAGGQVVGGEYTLGEVPLFVCEGCVVPLKTMASVVTPPDPLLWTVWPGGAAGGAGSYYEDDGVSVDYKTTAACGSGTPSAAAACFSFTWARAGRTLTATATAAGSYSGMPPVRSQGLVLRGGVAPPAGVTCSGAPVPEGPGVPGWYVVGAAASSLALPAGAVVVTCGPAPVSVSVVVALNFN